jgi:hypothetical protein
LSYPDPFEEKSPWDEDNTPTNTPNVEETKPMTDAATLGPAPFKIGFTLKAGASFEAEWLTPTVYGHSAEETAKRGAELLNALKAEGLIELTSKAAEYTRSQHKGSGAGPGRPAANAPKQFSGGKVQSKGNAAPPADDDCEHGRSLVEKATWAALFCNGPDGDKCEPLWRQKNGTYKAK